MSRSYRSLALAASSHRNSAEDRLTEIYAVALEEHRGFADRVFALANLPPAATYEAFTQEVLLDGSGRLDLKVRGLGRTGELVSLLYAEHKEPGGGFQDGQPEKYLPALRREAKGSDAEPRFMVVVGASEDVEGRLPGRTRPRSRIAVAEATDEADRLDQEGPLVVGRTWQDVANGAELAGRDAYVGDNTVGWREAAKDPAAPAAQRILREMLWYLEEEGYAVTNGLTATQLSTAVQALELEDRLGDLLDAATPLIVKARYGRYQLRTPQSARPARGVEFKAPADSWVDNWNGGLSLAYGVDEEGRAPHSRQLKFEAGVWLNRRHARELDTRPAFKSQLEPLKYGFDDGGWIWAEAPAVEFVTEDPDELLDAQAERLASWAIPQFQKVLSLRPGRRPSAHAKPR